MEQVGRRAALAEDERRVAGALAAEAIDHRVEEGGLHEELSGVPGLALAAAQGAAERAQEHRLDVGMIRAVADRELEPGGGLVEASPELGLARGRGVRIAQPV